MYLPEPYYDDPAWLLWTYDGTGAGWPTGWNLSHPLLERADELGQLEAFASVGLSERTVAFTIAGFDSASTVGIPIPPTSDPLALANHYNPRYPTLTHVAGRLAIGAMHFWDGGLTQRNRPASAGLWSAPTIRTMDLDGTVRTRANADYLGTYNAIDGTLKAALDCGLAEYQGGAPAAGPFFPLVRAYAHPGPFEGWLVERNGRAIPVTFLRSAPTFDPYSIGLSWRLVLPSGAAIYGGDSGALLLVELNGRLQLLGHVTYGHNPGDASSNQLAYCNAYPLPVAAYLSTLATPPTVNVPTIDGYQHARASTLAGIKAATEALLELFP